MTTKIYKSKLHDAIELISPTPTHIDAEGINSLSGLTYTFWKPDVLGTASQAFADFDSGEEILINYFAFDIHNLANTFNFDTIKLYGSNDSSFTPSFVLGSITQPETKSGANIKEFSNTTTYRYYRIEIAEAGLFLFSADPVIGIFYAGEVLDLPRGIKPSYTPPPLGIDAEILNNVSRSGNFIGRSVIKSGYSFMVKNELVPPSWIASNWIDLLSYIQIYPFFYSWNSLYPDDIVFCWTDGDITPPSYTDQANMSFSFKCNGFRS